MVEGDGELPVITGRVHKLGDDINTDVIYPGKFLAIYDPKEMAKHIMDGIDPTFAERFQPGDIIVAGKFFGCGSSREQAVLCLAAAGVGAIVAKSFARIYFRNGVNNGIWMLTSEHTDKIPDGANLRIDLGASTMTDVDSGKDYPLRPVQPFLQQIITKGGLVPHLRERLGIEAPASAD